jgi:hypothetical protein
MILGSSGHLALCQWCTDGNARQSHRDDPGRTDRVCRVSKGHRIFSVIYSIWLRVTCTYSPSRRTLHERNRIYLASDYNDADPVLMIGRARDNCLTDLNQAQRDVVTCPKKPVATRVAGQFVVWDCI